MKLAKNSSGERWLLLIGAVWMIAVMIGLLVLFEYQVTAGVDGIPAQQWPAESRIVPAVGQFHLVMAAHPRCPCTRASIESLARIMARAAGQATATVLFLKPRGAAAGWEQTDLWHSAAAIPGTQVACDDDGLEARRFGAATSGHVLLYDRHGRQLFSGGITSGRGHHGDNAGLNHCLAIINSEETALRDARVFGCPLQDSSACQTEGNESCPRNN